MYKTRHKIGAEIAVFPSGARWYACMSDGRAHEVHGIYRAYSLRIGVTGVPKQGVSSRFRWLTAFPLVLAIAIAGVTLSDQGRVGAGAREAVFDFYQRIQPRSERADGLKTVFVDIDRKTLEEIGPWPWPRTRLAELVAAANENGAALVVLDTPLSGADPLSPEQIAEIWEIQGNDALATALADAPNHDNVLAAALTAATSVTSLNARVRLRDLNASASERVDLRASEGVVLAEQGQADFLALPRARVATPPALALTEASAAVTVPDLPADADGVVRRAPMHWAVNGVARPALALSAARLAAEADNVAVDVDDTARWGVGPAQKKLFVGDIVIPVYPDGSVRLHLPKRLSATTVPARNVLDGSAEDALAGALVLVGSSVETVTEPVVTASGERPRAVVQAALIDQLLSGAGLIRPVWAAPAEAAAVLLLAILAIFAAQRLSFGFGVAAAFGGALLAFGGSWTLFTSAGLLLDPLPAAAAAFIGAFSVSIGVLFKEILSHDAVRGAVDDSLPPDVIIKLAEADDDAPLKGVRRDVTVLSCEIRCDYENDDTFRDNPKALPKLMRDVGKKIRQKILESGGAVEDIESGRLMGYWNAPMENEQHQQAACATALSLIESLDDLNADLEEAAEISGAPYAPVHLAIGLSAGECTAGAMGAGAHKRYSAVGEPVDVAAMLRSRSKLYGPAVIVDESVYRESHHRFAFLELDLLQYADSERPAHIYALLGNPFIKASPRYRAVDEAQRNILAAYRSGDWAAARDMLERAKELKGANPALYALYANRLDTIEQNGGAPGWTGAESVFL
ncbi:MAG: CHASE2 domain-containing protein [Pseudomonadota bacterium]